MKIIYNQQQETPTRDSHWPEHFPPLRGTIQDFRAIFPITTLSEEELAALTGTVRYAEVDAHYPRILPLQNPVNLDTPREDHLEGQQS